MKLTDQLEHATDWARQTKTELVQAHRTEARQTIQDVFFFWRGTQLVAIIQPQQSNARGMLHLAHIGVRGFDADMLVIVSETWKSNWSHCPSNIHPVTGEPLQPGDLGRLVREHQGRERGWVTDAVMIDIRNRAGDWVHRHMPFSVTHRTKLSWGEVETCTSDNPAVELVGPFASFLEKVMVQEPGITADLAQLGYSAPEDMDLEEQQAVRDAVTLASLLEKGAQGGLHLERGSRREQYVRRWLAVSGVSLEESE